ncbi:MAG TPA: NADH-quinone oxidoreductase subunit J [Telmatospirillum sp.]|nr:NADH-quinone oxidoreductase subunit J [Telmatospirillum sp.]
MEILAKIAFTLYALIILGGGLVAVTSANLVRALVGLIVTFFGVAGLYLLLNTPFLAFMQILIYVGAICVLVFFAIMLSRTGEEAATIPVKRRLYALLAGLAPAIGLALIIVNHPNVSKALPEEVPLPALGVGLLDQYSLSFELISMVLLVAMSGAVLLTWERKTKK